MWSVAVISCIINKQTNLGLLQKNFATDSITFNIVVHTVITSKETREVCL